MKDINKKRRKRGQAALDVGAMEAEARKTLIPGPVLAEGTFRSTTFHRPFGKMALAYAHHVLGETFTRSVDADRLRAFVWEPDDTKRVRLSGYIWPHDQTRLDGTLAHDDWHTIGILNLNAEIVFYCCLFGAFSGLIRLAKDSAPYLETIPHGSGVVYAYEPSTRRPRRFGYGEYLVFRHPVG